MTEKQVKTSENNRHPKCSSETMAFQMHGVFADFTVHQEVYKAAMDKWPRKVKINHQILPFHVLSFRGRRVSVRIFPNGKVHFTIAASQNPIDYPFVNAAFNLILRKLREICVLDDHSIAFHVTRADVHVDFLALPKLFPVVPLPDTTISIHRVKVECDGLTTFRYRVEVRGSFDESITTLARLLGVKKFSI